MNEPPRRERLLTVPNLLCVIRLIGSPVLVVAAALGWSEVSLGLYAFLTLTDWLDGKLAKLLKQETEFGARLDTVADVTFYTATVLAVMLLYHSLARQEWPFLALAGASYAGSVLVALLKYRKAPSYHTRLAKTSWLLIFAAIITLFAGGTLWVPRIALLGVCLTNLEAMLMTAVLPRWHANVPSLWHAWRLRQDRGPSHVQL